jgi:hypothetical protein
MKKCMLSHTFSQKLAVVLGITSFKTKNRITTCRRVISATANRKNIRSAPSTQLHTKKKNMPAYQKHEMDPTVASAEEKAVIERITGVTLKKIDTQALQLVVQRSKEAGNAAFKNKQYKGKHKI